MKLQARGDLAGQGLGTAGRSGEGRAPPLAGTGSGRVIGTMPPLPCPLIGYVWASAGPRVCRKLEGERVGSLDPVVAWRGGGQGESGQVYFLGA